MATVKYLALINEEELNSRLHDIIRLIKVSKITVNVYRVRLDINIAYTQGVSVLSTSRMINDCSLKQNKMYSTNLQEPFS